ncbi:MAG: hypothetical protein R6V58_12620 [Planctomycetota bacterium]
MSKLSTLILIGLLALAAPAAAAAAEGEKPVDVGSRRELFVDRHLIEKLGGGAALLLHRPARREVVLEHDEPWEGNTSGYHTIFKDGDVYRMYYRGWHYLLKGNEVKDGKEAHPPVVCYAESQDGVHWTKPELGLREFRGSKKNNIIWTGAGTHNFVPFKDANPKCRPDAKYKAVGGLKRIEGGLVAFKSADAIHWQRMAEEPILTDGAFDSQNLVFWDAVRGEYRAYYRDFRNGVRDIKTATTKDFLQWPKGRWLAYPGAPTEHLYTNQVQPYDRAPHLFVGFPTRYQPKRGSLVEGLFVTSRDGRTFHRWGEAIIRPGRNRDRWHNRSNYIWLGLVETKSGLPGGAVELSLYSNERYYKGKGVKTRRYTYRPDGFVSVHAPLRGGTVLTKPLTFAGKTLRLNASTSAAGSARVEIRRPNGRPAKGFAAQDCDVIYGDELDRVVTWNGKSDVGSLAGKPVRMLITLKDADVYSFRFAR